MCSSPRCWHHCCRTLRCVVNRRCCCELAGSLLHVFVDAMSATPSSSPCGQLVRLTLHYKRGADLVCFLRRCWIACPRTCLRSSAPGLHCRSVNYCCAQTCHLLSPSSWVKADQGLYPVTNVMSYCLMLCLVLVGASVAFGTHELLIAPRECSAPSAFSCLTWCVHCVCLPCPAPQALAHSPQFHQQLATFGGALQTGQLDLAQFGLQAEVRDSRRHRYSTQHMHCTNCSSTVHYD